MTATNGSRVNLHRFSLQIELVIPRLIKVRNSLLRAQRPKLARTRVGIWGGKVTVKDRTRDEIGVP